MSTWLIMDECSRLLLEENITQAISALNGSKEASLALLARV